MKLWIALLSALLTLVLAQTSIAREVDGTKVKPFKAGEKAIADDVNNNFKELRGAINDNFTVIKTHKNTIGAHGGSGSGAGGDGSAGALTIGGGDWVTPVTGGTPIPTNLNYTSCLIGDKATATNQLELKVPSGITIRCQDGFTLNANATITVGNGFGAGVGLEPKYAGTYESKGLLKVVAIASIDLMPLGGAGNDGGGLLRILSNGPIKIDGTINSNGKAGHYGGISVSYGGGGGGIIVLNSRTSIDVAGMITANGGNGGKGAANTSASIGPTGGGGGGIISLVAPTITNSINTEVKAGIGSNAATDYGAAAGTFGGASGGDGGRGGDGYYNSIAGTAGYVIEIKK